MAKYLPPEGYILDETTGLYVNETKITDISGNTMTMVMTFNADTGEFKQKMAEPAVAEPEEPVEELEAPIVEVEEPVAEPEATIVEPKAQGGLKPPPPIPAAMINPAAPPARLQPQPAPQPRPVAQPQPQPAPQPQPQPQPVAHPRPVAQPQPAPQPRPVPQQQPQPMPQSQSVPQPAYNPYMYYGKPAKKSKGGLIAALIIAACLVLGIVIILGVIIFKGRRGVFSVISNRIGTENSTSATSASTNTSADIKQGNNEPERDEYGIPIGLIEIFVKNDEEADFVFHGDKAQGTDLRWLSFFTGEYLITAFDSDNDDIKEIQEVGIYMKSDNDYKYVGHAEYYIDGNDFVICADSLIVPDLDFTRLSSWGKLDYGYYDGTEFNAQCNMKKYVKSGSYDFSPGIKSDEQKPADLFGGTDYATEDEYYQDVYSGNEYTDYYEDEYYEGPQLTNVTVPASHYCGIFYCDDFDTFDRASAPTIALYENGTFEIYANFMEGFCSYYGEFSVEQKGSDIYVNLFNYDALNGVPTTATIKFSANDPDYLWFLDPGFGVMGYRFGDGPFGFYRDMRG